MRWLAKLLFPKMAADAANYRRMMVALNEAALELSYTFPTVGTLTNWLSAQVSGGRAPTIVELMSELRDAVGDDEAVELAGRLKKAIDHLGQDQVKH